MLFFSDIDILELRRGSMEAAEAATTTTGPNDAKRVVWAFGVSFLFFLRVFFLLNDIYRFF